MLRLETTRLNTYLLIPPHKGRFLRSLSDRGKRYVGVVDCLSDLTHKPTEKSKLSLGTEKVLRWETLLCVYDPKQG